MTAKSIYDTKICDSQASLSSLLKFIITTIAHYVSRFSLTALGYGLGLT